MYLRAAGFSPAVRSLEEQTARTTSGQPAKSRQPATNHLVH